MEQTADEFLASFSQSSSDSLWSILGDKYPESSLKQYKYVNYLLLAEYKLFSDPLELLQHQPRLIPGSEAKTSRKLSKILFSLRHLPIDSPEEPAYFITQGGNRLWRVSESVVYLSDGLHEIKIELSDDDPVDKGTSPEYPDSSERELLESYAKLRFRDFQRKPVSLSFSDANNEGDVFPEENSPLS